MTKEEQIFRMVYTGEEREWDHAALVLEHEEQEEEYFKMQHKESPSDVRVYGMSASNAHVQDQRTIVLKVSGYGYGQRPPSFSISENYVHMYISAEEARDIAAKLLNFVLQEERREKAS